MHTDFEIVKYSYLFNKEVVLGDKEPINFGCSAHANRCNTDCLAQFFERESSWLCLYANELFRIYRLL